MGCFQQCVEEVIQSSLNNKMCFSHPKREGVVGLGSVNSETGTEHIIGTTALAGVSQVAQW